MNARCFPLLLSVFAICGGGTHFGSPARGETLEGTVASDESQPASEPIDFNRDIRPLLSSNCLTCHGPDEAERAAGLRLDTQSGSREDLGGYAAVVPGDPEESELLARLTSDDPDVQMPPEGKGRRFTEAEVDLIRRWISEGAAYAKHWSYEKPVRPPLPKVAQRDWLRNPIDHFVLARLEAAGLRPSPPASRLVLARRLSLDLIGLPPTWEEAIAFANDDSDDAYARYVDRLLEKSAYGERWARVWLDLARYADSAGYADDPPRTIWGYRDYVIRSLNANKPFDQFTIEQIAGDLLADPSDEQLIATAFHRNTMTNNEGGTNNEEFRNVAVVDRVNTTMAVWMGTTMACAQCHTHKYDPITQDEYFQFFAFFNSTEDADARDERPTLAVWSERQEEQKAEWEARVASLKKVLDTPTADLQSAQQQWLEQIRGEPTWQPLTPTGATARKRELAVEAEGWIKATGEKPEQEGYTLEFPTQAGSLTGLRLEVGEAQRDNFVITNASATWTPTGASAVEARFVRVEIPGKNRLLHLAELQAFSGGQNIALQGAVKQSSTDYGGEAKFAIDGITDGDFNKHKTTHTAQGNDPWLEVDLGKSAPIESLVVWNRSDGGNAIRDRLRGFTISLLDEKRAVVWKDAPDVPSPRGDYAPGGGVTLNFSAAVADYEQKNFPAQSTIGKPDPKKGWAVGGATGKAHSLTLLLSDPQPLREGTLRLSLAQDSVHQRHVLDQFRVSSTDDRRAGDWARLPAKIRELVRKPHSALSDDQALELAAYYRSIAPALEPQRTELAKLQKQLADLRPYTTVPVMRELADERRRTTKVQLRGNYLSTGDVVREGTPAVFHALPEGRRDRLALARWLVDEKNPLTPRVIANRHWEQLFGVGIVETSEEFGSQGELPSHPELLDWLAVELREGGWDLKAFLKLIVMSATYRQSSAIDDSRRHADPDNRLFSRGPRFRVSAEMVRDQALFVSGLLSDKKYGPPVKPPQPQLGLKAAFGSATDWKTSGGEDKFRRALYTTWRRSSPYPSMAQFDAPNREVCTVRRIRTNTPLQALVTLNDPVYVEAAQSLARRMVGAGKSAEERLQFAFRTCLIRDPNPTETERLTQLARDVTEHFASQPDQAMKLANPAGGKPPAEVGVPELAAWTVVANVLLNVDEIFMKR